MADSVIVTREQLADALKGVRVTVYDGDDEATGPLAQPDGLAAALFEDFSEEMRKRFTGPPVFLPMPPEPPELERYARICAEIDAMDANGGRRAVVRVIDYLDSRYADASGPGRGQRDG